MNCFTDRLKPACKMRRCGEGDRIAQKQRFLKLNVRCEGELLALKHESLGNI